jgi:hypothetical protein
MRMGLKISVLVAVTMAASVGATAEGAGGGDAYVRADTVSLPDATWVLGTSRMERMLTLSGGRFVLTSFLNKMTSPPKEYVQGADAARPADAEGPAASPEFSATVNGAVCSGAGGGWALDTWSTNRLPQGECALDIRLRNGVLAVTRHFVVYPGTAVVREWTTYENAGAQDATVSDASFLDMLLMSEDCKAGLTLGHITGGKAYDGAQRLVTENVAAGYANTFASTASSDYLPFMMLFNDAARHGLFFGWDYLGPWAAPLGAAEGKAFHCRLVLAGYTRTLEPGERFDTPRVFTGCFAGDLDDMGNQILDWQYQYLWEHKHAAYFAQPRYAVDWPAPWVNTGGGEENWGCRLALDLYYIDLARYAGAGVLWDDAGWYDAWGSWNGPDFGETVRYLNKYGMKLKVWFPTFLRTAGSQVDHDLAGAVKMLDSSIDQSSPAATQWQLDLLDRKTRAWGGFQWRYDIAPGAGSDPLAADQEFRRLNREFLAAHPDQGIDACFGGGNWIGVDLASYSDSGEMTDGGTRDYSGYHSSLFIPPDLLHNVVYFSYEQGRKAYSMHNDRIQLRMDPDWYGDPASKKGYSLKATHPAGSTLAIPPEAVPHLEALRKDWDLYRYLVHEQVAGRWGHVFRPKVDGDDPVLYFQRMNRDGTKGVILTTRSFAQPQQMPAGAVTIFPKGLVQDIEYDVRFDIEPRVEKRLGADLMERGVTFEQLKPGEIVYLNLDGHPGSGNDTTPPGPPRNVTKRIATNIHTQGVEICWEPAEDTQWLSGYELLRVEPDGARTDLGKVSKGTYAFDHSRPGVDLISCRYEVRALDGDGNVSPFVEAELEAGEPERRHLFEGFGDVQGFQGWTYEAARDGQALSDAGRPRLLAWHPEAGYEGQWLMEPKAEGETTPGAVARTFMLPHPDATIARVFTVRRAGNVSLRGVVRRDLPPGTTASAECRVRILLNGQPAWPEAGWQQVPADRTGVYYDCAVAVRPGDRIEHAIEQNPDWKNAGIGWYGAIEYAGG